MSVKLLRRTFDFEIRAAKPDGSYFEGHAAVHCSIDSYGTIMGRGCFAKRMDFFLQRGFIGGLNHNWNDPIGSPKLAREDDKGLFVGADVLDTSHGSDVRKLLAGKVCRFLSIGFDVLARAYLERAEDVKKYWESVAYTPTEQDLARSQYGALLFTEVQVYEASPVMVPGNDYAEITSVRGAALERLPLDEHLRTALATAEEISERIEQLATLRASDGRGVPPERRALLRQMRDRIDRALAATEPRATDADLRALRLYLLKIESGL